VNALANELEARGVRSKVHLRSNGETRGGARFSRGALFHLLRNRIYIGEIIHKKLSYPGQHEAIIDVSLFDRVQRRLAQNAIQGADRRFESAPLTGLVYDATGARMTPAHAYGKGGTRYRYYVSAAGQGTTSGDYVRRVSAAVLEELVLDRMRAMLGQAAAGWPEVLKLLRRVEVRARCATLEIGGMQAADLPEDATADWQQEPAADGRIRIRVPACMQPRRGGTRVSAPAARLRRTYYNKPLIAALKRAHHELARSGFSLSGATAQLSDARGLADPYLRSIAPLAFLAPDIQSAIVLGRQPPGLNLKRLTHEDIPLDWDKQRGRFGFSETTLVASADSAAF
jgi:hypothetical protein